MGILYFFTAYKCESYRLSWPKSCFSLHVYQEQVLAFSKVKKGENCILRFCSWGILGILTALDFLIGLCTVEKQSSRQQLSVQDLHDIRVRKQAEKIFIDETQPGNSLFQKLPSGKVCHCIRTCNTLLSKPSLTNKQSLWYCIGCGLALYLDMHHFVGLYICMLTHTQNKVW